MLSPHRASSCAVTHISTHNYSVRMFVSTRLLLWLVAVWSLEPRLILRGEEGESPTVYLEMRWAWVASAFPFNSTVSADSDSGLMMHAAWTPDCPLLPRLRPVPAMVWRCPSALGAIMDEGLLHDGCSLWLGMHFEPLEPHQIPITNATKPINLPSRQVNSHPPGPSPATF